MYMGLKLLKWLEMDFKHKFKKLVQFYPPGAKPSFYEAFNLHLFGPDSEHSESIKSTQREVRALRTIRLCQTVGAYNTLSCSIDSPPITGTAQQLSIRV